MAGVAAEVFWAVGLILLAVCCYFVQHWRYIQLAISIPTLVTLLYIWWVMMKNVWEDGSLGNVLTKCDMNPSQSNDASNNGEVII